MRTAGKVALAPLVLAATSLVPAIAALVCTTEKANLDGKTSVATEQRHGTEVAVEGITPPVAGCAPGSAAAPDARLDVPSGSPLSPVTVLVYHKLTAAPTGDTFTMPVALFEAQMQLLVAEGYRTILSADYLALLRDGKPAPAPAVVLTFDDWTPDHYELARPILNRLGLKAIFFVTTEKIGSDAERAKLRTLASEGHEIASHTVHHYFVGQSPCDKDWKCCRQRRPCTDAEIRTELGESRATLEAVLGTKVTGFAWPGNFFDARLTKMARAAGYETIYAVERQVTEDGVPTNRVGVTRSPETIYRTEISGQCDLPHFRKALVDQRCCVVSARPFHRFCVPQAEARP